MTTINPTSTQSLTLLRRAGFTPPSADLLRNLAARRIAPPGGDGTDLSGAVRQGAGLSSIDATRRGLNEVSALLDQLTDRVNSLAAGKDPSGDTQGIIDGLIESIQDAASRTGLGGFAGDGFSVGDIARQVTNLSVYNVKLAPGQEERVEIDVRASAQQAGLFMDFAGGVLDLAGPSRSFTIEVGGRNGTKELTFSSGTSAESIAQAINAFAKQTGVDARLSGTGVRLESHATGSAELTSIRVLDDGGASDDAGRIYRMRTDNALAADPETKMTFDSIIAHSGSGIRDKGQDAEVWVNGQKAAVYGSEVLASNDKFSAMFYLDRLPGASSGPDAQRLGKFTGFAIRADGQIVPSDPKPTPKQIGPDRYDAEKVPGVNGVDPLPPPQGDYGAPTSPVPIGPDMYSADGGPGVDGVDMLPPPQGDYGTPPAPADDPKDLDDSIRPAAAEPKPPKRPGNDGDDSAAAAGNGPAIDPTTFRAAIDRLTSRIGARTSALDLMERVGLNVVPASLSGVFGIADSDRIDYPSALSIARTLRGTVLGADGNAGDLAGRTTSAQVLRLLGVDGNR